MKFSQIALLVVGCAVTAQAFTLPDMSAAHHLVARGFGGGLIDANGVPQKIGTLNKLITGVIELLRGTNKGLEAGVTSLLTIVVPTLRIILAGSDIHMCRPQTATELVLWDLKEFLNNEVKQDLGTPTVDLCVPSEEQAPSKELREKITQSHKANREEWQMNEFGDQGEGDTTFDDPEALAGDDGEDDEGDEEEGEGEDGEGEGEEDGPSSSLDAPV